MKNLKYLKYSNNYEKLRVSSYFLNKQWKRRIKSEQRTTGSGRNKITPGTEDNFKIILHSTLSKCSFINKNKQICKKRIKE